MQSFIIHHCVLLLLTLTFTTDPVSAEVCNVWGKLHQSVILPCEHKCPGLAKWNDLKTRSVFAECDQTSCRSITEGYKMSHDQYLKGDLSLTITAADYSKRNTYACECALSDFSVQRLSISTVFSAVQTKSGEDVLLDLSVPESVMVFYRSGDADDEELICNVTQNSVQCKSEYTSRTSLHHPQLTLRGVTSSDSGIYTIRNTDYNEDIHVYTVSVTGLSKTVIAVTVVVVVVVVMVLVIVGVIMYRKKAAAEKKLREQLREQQRREQQRREEEEEQLKRQQDEVDEYIEKMTSVKTDTDAGMSELKKRYDEAQLKVEELHQDYSEHERFSERVTLFCDKKTSVLEKYHIIYSTYSQDQECDEEQIIQNTERLARICEVLKQGRLPHQYLNRNFKSGQLYLQKIKNWCKKKREEVKQSEREENKDMTNMKTLLSMYDKWCRSKWRELVRYREKHDLGGKDDTYNDDDDDQ